MLSRINYHSYITLEKENKKKSEKKKQKQQQPNLEAEY